MKYIKLFLISVVVFGIMLFCISLLFPSTTIVSRAVNVRGKKDSVIGKLPAVYATAFQQQGETPPLDAIRYANGDGQAYSDTLLQTSPFASNIQQGAAMYQTAADSTVIQVFYKIHVPAYKFWDKFGLMLNETKYGPSLDSAVKKIEERF